VIDPQASVSQILLNNPDLAVPLFDLLIWVNQPNLAENDDYDRLLELLYGKTQNCRDARDVYAKNRAA